MSSIEQHQILSDSYAKKCPVCATYQRKIFEIEQTLSGRDSIIILLQNQLKKCQLNYTKLFDDYEKLRFQYCTAVQDNFSLKEINEKLEEFSFKNKTSSRNSCSQYDRRIDTLDLKRECEQGNSVIQEVNKIESLISTQNQILKQLLDKIINELKVCRCDSPEIAQNINKIEEEFRNIESGDHLDTDPNINDLLQQVETLKTLLDKYKLENDCMKELLNGKKNSLSECKSILQDTSKSINKISSSIDNFVKNTIPQKSNLIEDREDSELTSLNMETKKYKTKLSQLEYEMKEKEAEFEMCRCEMIGQMNDLSDNNQILSDTLEVMKAENMNNLATVAQLKEELNKVNEECEKKHGNMKIKIDELENELEMSKINEKQLRKSVDISENNSKKLKEKMKFIIEENSKLKECRCDGGFELKQRIAMLESSNGDMRRDITEKTLELSEYEEENRALSQKMDGLIKTNGDLQEKIRELEEELQETSKRTEKYTISTQMSADFSTDDLKTQVNQLNTDKQCLQEKCRDVQKEANRKLGEIDVLKNSIRLQMSEISELSKENEDLRKQLEGLKYENKKETERLQSMVNHSQQQVEMLLREHDEKTAQIQSVANELDGIRRSVNEENSNYVAKIVQLEKERDQLKKNVEEYEAHQKDCRCEEGRIEIERLQEEIIKKQCVILELEKTMDNFNTTVNQLEQNIEDLACENACLKDDRNKKIRELETLQNKLKEKNIEIAELQKRLENSETEYQKGSRHRRSLEMENERFRAEIDKLKKEQDSYRRSSDTERLELQMEIEGLKQEDSRRCSNLSGKLQNLQKAYDEVKNQCAKKCFENEKLEDDLQNSKRLIEELKQANSVLRSENERFKNQHRESVEEQYKLTERIEDLKDCYDRIKKECTLKCVENEDLRERFEEQRRKLKDFDAVKNKLTEKERELLDVREKLDGLQKMYEQRNEELRKMKKQYEACSKQSQISRDEYNNLRKEYKEIKSMLSDQIKKYKKDVDGADNSQSSQKPCKIVCDLKKQLLEKEGELIVLHQKLKDSSYEIIELKDYIHKLISDNNILKTAINNLIGNLERKIKGPSFGSLPANSADAIAGEILQSLTSIENTIIEKSHSYCMGRCPEKDCDCMSKIQSQYNITEPKPESGASKCQNPISGCCSTCCMKRNSSSEPTCNNKSHQPSEIIGSELSTTTDSEDCHCSKFTDKRSLEFLKDAIKGLKTSKDNTMKEKSCDCEEYRSRNN